MAPETTHDFSEQCSKIEEPTTYSHVLPSKPKQGRNADCTCHECPPSTPSLTESDMQDMEY